MESDNWITQLFDNIDTKDTPVFLNFLAKDANLHARRKRGMCASAAVRHAFNTVGTAMWITTVALVAGFLVLVFSGYKMNSDMGLMTTIAITLARVMDFLFLPGLLMRMEGEGKLKASPVEVQGYPAPYTGGAY